MDNAMCEYINVQWVKICAKPEYSIEERTAILGWLMQRAEGYAAPDPSVKR